MCDQKKNKNCLLLNNDENKKKFRDKYGELDQMIGIYFVNYLYKIFKLEFSINIFKYNI